MRWRGSMGERASTAFFVSFGAAMGLSRVPSAVQIVRVRVEEAIVAHWRDYRAVTCSHSASGTWGDLAAWSPGSGRVCGAEAQYRLRKAPSRALPRAELCVRRTWTGRCMFQILIAMAALVSPPTASYLHIWGLPWSLKFRGRHGANAIATGRRRNAGAAAAAADRKARRTGRALLRLRCEDAAACVTALHGQSVGSRWLEGG